MLCFPCYKGSTAKAERQHIPTPHTILKNGAKFLLKKDFKIKKIIML